MAVIRYVTILIFGIFSVKMVRKAGVVKQKAVTEFL